MIPLREAIKAIEYHTKVDITRAITALVILEKNESIQKSHQAQLEIPKLYSALFTMYHAMNQNGERIGGLTDDEILGSNIELTRILQKYSSAYSAAMRYMYPIER